MAGALYIPGADRSTRWFLDDYPGQFVMPRIDKTLLHSTETSKRGSCPGYSGGGTAPQVTINPWAGYRKIWQHFPINRAGRALGNPSSTPVSENKDNVFQVEIIGFSDPKLGREYGCYLPELTDSDLDYLVEMLAFVHKEWPHSTVLPSTWPLYKVSSWAAMDAAHMTSSQYDNFRGILAHLHAPSPSTHGDIAIKIQTVKAKLDKILSGGSVATISPVYRGTPEAQEVIKALLASDVFGAPDKSTTNPYWGGASWFNFVGRWSRETVLEVREISARLDTLEAKLDQILAKMGAAQ